MRAIGSAIVSTATLLLSAGSIASAADMAVKAPLYQAPVTVAPNWTGFYIGGHAGYGWASDKTTTLVGNIAFPVGTTMSAGSKAALGGLQAGFNYQITNWVFGVEGDFSWTGANGSTTSISPLIAGVSSTLTVNYSSYATVTGRVGYAWNDVLVFAKGGGAFARVEYGGYSIIPGGILVPTPISDTLSGWTVGAGLEYSFTRNWSAKAEYNYLDFGSTQRTFLTGGVPGPATKFDTHVDVVKVGLNYRFTGL